MKTIINNLRQRTGNTAFILRLTTTLLLFVGLAQIAGAQQTTATIVGNVTDSSGASLGGATVTVVNTGTNTARSTTTETDGRYSLPSLAPGSYDLSVEMAGFKKQRISNIVLDASQTARQDLALSVGEVTNTVDVSASAAQAVLQTENGGVGEVIDGKKIVDLPLNGRNFIQLAQLIPGVNTGTSGSITVRRARGSVGSTDPNGGTTAIQVNGQRDTQNRYSIDGIESMDYDAFTYSFSTSVDAIAEFRVDTSSSGPDGGAAAGANVNQILKSGGNKLHGTLFEFNRNNVFTQTYDAVAKIDKIPARLNRNQFGGNIGGPVVIPHIYNGHDKTFFFINAETGFALNGANPQQATLPDATVRSGILDSSIFAGPVVNKVVTVLPVTDPFTGTPYKVGDKITLNANSAAYLAPNITPLPTTPGAVDPIALPTNYSTTPVKTLNFQHQYIGRVDHTLGKKDSINGHYIYDDTFSNGPSFFGHDNDDNDAVTKHFVIAETHQFSSSIVNDFRYGRQDFKEFETFGTTNNPAYNIANGVLNIPFSSSDPHFFGGINLTIAGNGQSYKTFSDIRNIGPRNRSNGINQFVDSLSWQRGKHFMKFGADIGRRTDFFSQARDPHGTFNFDGRYTGSALLDFLLGYVATDSINPTVTRTNISSLIQAYSFQDNWTVRKGLTLNLGIRWDHYAPYTQDDDKYADIYTSADGLNPAAVATPANSPYGRGLIKPTYHDFQPRLGFAWQPYDKMVVRGAYGLYFTPEIDNVWFAMAEGAQAQAGAALTGNPGPATGTTAALKLPNISFTNPFPGVVAGGPNTYPFAVQLDQNLQDQVTSQFNVFVQMQLPSKFSAEVGYVGAIGRHNFVTENVNIPVPIDPLKAVGTLNSRRPNQSFPRNVQADFSNGSSSYNSLQTKIERRVGKGLNVLTSYTWSKSISGAGDIGGAVGGGFYGSAPLNVYAPATDRSVSLFDIPQRFVGTVLYDIPFFQHSSGFKKAVLSGFQVSTIFSAVSGIPAGITDTTQTTATGIASRADRIVGVPVSLGRAGRTQLMQFNTAAFGPAQPGEFGTSARTGAVRLPGLLNDDFSATKGFQFGEGRNLQLRADFFNLTKHYNPDPSTIGLARNASGTFGKINDGLSGGFATRIIQLGAKLYF